MRREKSLAEEQHNSNEDLYLSNCNYVVVAIEGGIAYNMSIEDKMIARLLSRPTDYRFSELETLLRRLGFEISNKGRTSGSRVIFIARERGGLVLSIHKPHPGNGNCVKRGVISDVIEVLRNGGFI